MENFVSDLESVSMTMVPAEISQIRDRLAERFDPQRIILFGSRARGDADSRSDVDLVVITRWEGRRRALVSDMYRALRGMAAACDIVVMSPEEFERSKTIPGTIAGPASREGRVIYERAA
jgi:predicted nucleotidyltransferase